MFDSGGGFPNRLLSDSPWQTTFERFAMSTPVPLRSDFDAIGLRMLARRSRDPDQTRRLLSPSKDGAGRDLRWRLAAGCGTDRRGRGADRARLGCPFQRQGSRWSFERQGARRSKASRRAPAPGVAAGRGRWADSRPAWRRALAVDRSGAVALRRVPGLDLQADAQPRAAAYGLSQALGATAPSWARRGSRGGF